MNDAPTGRDRSRTNSLKHGLSATDTILIAAMTESDREIFSEIRSRTHSNYNPKTIREKELVDRISIQHFRMYRLYALETIATDCSIEKPLDAKSILPHLDRFSRYDTRISREIRTLHNMLRTLYIERKDYSLNLFPRQY